MHNLSKWSKNNCSFIAEKGKGKIEEQCYICLQEIRKCWEAVENQ